MQCLQPPNGWRCTRPAGHDGPCAAVPIGTYVPNLLRLFMCVLCVDEHVNAQSVSCYCACHDSIRDENRWADVRPQVLAALQRNAR